MMRGCVVKRASRQGRARYYVKLDTEGVEGGARWLTDPATGRAFTRRRDAQAFLTSTLHAVQAGSWVAPSEVTLAEHTAGWLTLARGRLKPATWASYRSVLHAHVLPTLGEVPVQEISTGHLDRLYLALLTGGRRDGRPLAARTVHYVHTLTKAVLADAVRKGLLTHNPAVAATPPAPTPAAAASRTWTGRQLAQFLHHTVGTPRGALWAFLALTGCRRGEALGLRWSDVDDTAGQVLLAHTIGAIAGRVSAGTPKSGRGRTVAIDAGLVERLHAHRRAQTCDRMAAPSWTDEDLVFPGPSGRAQHPDTVSRAFRRAATAHGLPPIRLHDLRHTWATLALHAGVHPKVVQERLGHSSVTITLGIYSHVLPSLHAQAAGTVAALIDEQRPAGARLIR